MIKEYLRLKLVDKHSGIFYGPLQKQENLALLSLMTVFNWQDLKASNLFKTNQTIEVYNHTSSMQIVHCIFLNQMLLFTLWIQFTMRSFFWVLQEKTSLTYIRHQQFIFLTSHSYHCQVIIVLVINTFEIWINNLPNWWRWIMEGSIHHPIKMPFCLTSWIFYSLLNLQMNLD